MCRGICATLAMYILLLAVPVWADDSGQGTSASPEKSAEKKDWARQDGPRLNIGIDLDMSGSATTIPADVGAHEVNVGVMGLIAYESNRIFAVTLRGGYLGSLSYGGSTSKTTGDGFLVPILVGVRLQLPFSIFRFHIEAAMGYAYSNRFNRWVRSGSGASMHQLIADLRFGAAVFFTPFLSVDAAVFYRLPNILVRVIDSKDSEYAHTVGMTLGVGFHF